MLLFVVNSFVFPPKVGKAVKGETLQSEKVLARPHSSKLHGHFAVRLAYVFVERFQVKRVAICLVVHEIVYTSQPCRIDGVAASDATIVFHLKAQWGQFGVLPKVQTTRYFEIGAAGGHTIVGIAFVLLVVEVVVDEEIGVTPFVRLEHFKRHGYIFAVRTKVVEHLHVNLCQGCPNGEQAQKY